MVATIHIRPTAELAQRVLLPGDPGRAFRLAQELLEAPKMFNHHRGLWGYTGAAADGRPLTIQSTGMGGPSSAIVVSELIALGATRLLRIGTCGGLSSELRLGALVVASEAIGDDGTSAALSGGAPVTGPLASNGDRRFAADAELVDALVGAGEVVVGPIVSTDLFYDADHLIPAWIEAGALAVEMEAATLFALAAKRGVQAGCITLVSNMLVGANDYIDGDALHAAEVTLGRVAAAALAE